MTDRVIVIGLPMVVLLGILVLFGVTWLFHHHHWRPFAGMTNEGFVTGHWVDADGTEFTDVCVKVSIECDRSRLHEAVRAVRRVGRTLGQRAMYFEVSGYDGVQILRIE